MTTKRKIFLLFLLSILLLGHLLVRLNRFEWWPFSNYPMYAKVFKPNYVYFHEVWAVYETGKEEKLAPWTYFHPFSERSLEEAFLRSKDPKKLQEIIQSLHLWYEKQAPTRNWKNIKKLVFYRLKFDFQDLSSKKSSYRDLEYFRYHPIEKIALSESRDE